MASLTAARIFQQNCSKCIVGSSNLNIFYRRATFKPMMACVQNQNQTVPSNFQKVEFSVSSVKSSSDQELGHDHVKHWTAERVVSVALLGSIPAACVISSPWVEYFLAVALTIHSQWGIEAIVCDYVRPSQFGKVIPKIALAAVYGLSALTLGGLFFFIYTDVGLINAVRLLWKL